METAFKEGHEDFLTVNTGKLFLEVSPMLHAFESPLPRINLELLPHGIKYNEKKARVWTGFNWPLQCCLQQI
jgi:hypothetical protein